MASLPTRSINFTTIQCVFLSVLWIGLSCIAEINDGGDFGEVFGKLGNRQREFDYFKLALQWPGTACRTTRHCCSSNACCRRSNALTEFTIRKSNYHILEHIKSSDGLWPDYNDGTWPACCSGKRFDVKELVLAPCGSLCTGLGATCKEKKAMHMIHYCFERQWTAISILLSVLNKYWPSLSCNSPSNCHGGKGLFWEHEWEKHGTCSSPVVRDEYGYFVTALNLYFKYNVTEVLREAGYVASNSEKYPLGGIVSAIQNAFHATPELECSGDAVEELRLCFYKDFKIRDCAVESNTESGITNTEKSCPRYISLPEFVSLKLENKGAEASQSTFKSSM